MVNDPRRVSNPSTIAFVFIAFSVCSVIAFPYYGFYYIRFRFLTYLSRIVHILRFTMAPPSSVVFLLTLRRVSTALYVYAHSLTCSRLRTLQVC
jgi:hypothetical protein